MIQRKPFYFLRHAETEHNIQHLCAGGQTDSLLTDHGIQQAKAASAKVEKLDYTHVIASPLLRTRHTATLATRGKAKVHLEPSLREWDLGDFEQSAVADFLRQTSDLAPDVPLPNGESALHFKDRVITTLNKWLSPEDAQPLFVSHGLVYMTILETLNLQPVLINNATLAHFVPTAENWAISYL